MAQLLGILNVAEAAADRTYVQTIGQRVVYDAVTQLINQYNQDLDKALAVFVERETSDHTFRYKLPGGGRLQRRGGLGLSGAVKATGQWDVAFPLEDFGAAFGGDEISMAYMTAAEVERNLKTVMLQDTNTVRFELLKTLFVNTSRTFVDEIKGSLTIQPLANGDGTVYPPVLGSESEADDTHHLETNYATSSISDTNNPYATIRDELEEHFGANQGGSNIVVFINPTATAKTEALTGFVKYADKFVVVGSNTATVSGLPTNIPGRIIGRVSGCWVSEWRWGGCGPG
jgi:hypothetical protein